MGLDVSHDCFRGSYSGFSRFREALAVAADIPLRRVEVGPGFSVLDPMIDWSAIVPENYAGEWQATPSEALVVLFAHADDSGVIHPAQAAPLADRLESLIPKLASPYDRIATRFAAGLRQAAACDEVVEFS